MPRYTVEVKVSGWFTACVVAKSATEAEEKAQDALDAQMKRPLEELRWMESKTEKPEKIK